MKRILLAMVFVAVSLLPSGAQGIRTNYRLEGMTHISTDYERLETPGADPCWTRVELVGFPDGSSMYLLYLNLESKKPFTVPKGVKMTVTLANSRVVRADQIGKDNPTKSAYEDNGRRFYWNRLKYAVETGDMEKMVRGVQSLELTTGWGPDDYLQYKFQEDAFGSLLKRHCEAILHAADSTIDLSAEIAGRTESKSSIMTATKPIVAKGTERIYNVLLSHLYYKATNTEDIDLAFQIGAEEAYHVPYDALVAFTLADGSVVSLKQTRDEDNFVYLFPSMEELRRLSTGITAISIPYEGGTLTDTFTEAAEGFSAAIVQQYNLLISLSPR